MNLDSLSTERTLSVNKTSTIYCCNNFLKNCKIQSSLQFHGCCESGQFLHKVVRSIFWFGLMIFYQNISFNLLFKHQWRDLNAFEVCGRSCNGFKQYCKWCSHMMLHYSGEKQRISFLIILTFCTPNHFKLYVSYPINGHFY